MQPPLDGGCKISDDDGVDESLLTRGLLLLDLKRFRAFLTFLVLDCLTREKLQTVQLSSVAAAIAAALLHDEKGSWSSSQISSFTTDAALTAPQLNRSNSALETLDHHWIALDSWDFDGMCSAVMLLGIKVGTRVEAEFDTQIGTK